MLQKLKNAAFTRKLFHSSWFSWKCVHFVSEKEIIDDFNLLLYETGKKSKKIFAYDQLQSGHVVTDT